MQRGGGYIVDKSHAVFHLQDTVHPEKCPHNSLKPCCSLSFLFFLLWFVSAVRRLRPKMSSGRASPLHHCTHRGALRSQNNLSPESFGAEIHLVHVLRTETLHIHLHPFTSSTMGTEHFW